jgi:hypothetical protein
MRVLKLTLGKIYFFANFPLVSVFQCETFGRIYSCVRMHAAQMSRRLSDTSGHARSCLVLTWQWPSGRVSYMFGRVPYRFKLAFFFPLHRIASILLNFSSLCDFGAFSSCFSMSSLILLSFSASFLLFLLFFSIFVNH